MSIGGDELVLHGDNTRALYREKLRVATVLAKQRAKGSYDRDFAMIRWRRLALQTSKDYTREFGIKGDRWYTLFTSADREHAAKNWASWFAAEHKLGNFEYLLPPKLQKAKTRKAAAAALKLAESSRGKRSFQ